MLRGQIIKIGSVTAEILLTLSFCGGGGGWGGWGGLWCFHSHFIVKPNLVLRLGWDFDNEEVLGILNLFHQ